MLPCTNAPFASHGRHSDEFASSVKSTEEPLIVAQQQVPIHDYTIEVWLRKRSDVYEPQTSSDCDCQSVSSIPARRANNHKIGSRSWKRSCPTRRVVALTGTGKRLRDDVQAIVPRLRPSARCIDLEDGVIFKSNDMERQPLSRARLECVERAFAANHGAAHLST
jgi:hypothetical protein